MGQLGDGTLVNINYPVQIGTDTNWKTIGASHLHGAGIKTDGTLWGWGHNFYGELGDGTLIDRHTPTQIGTDHDWGHTLAIKTNGTLLSWGYHADGGLGIGVGPFSNINVPTQVTVGTHWKYVGTGDYHSLMIRDDGTLWTCGWNYYGQIGDGSHVDKDVPTQIGTATDWAFVDGGFGHSIALKSDGSLYAWGENSYGALGDGTSNSNRNFYQEQPPAYRKSHNF